MNVTKPSRVPSEKNKLTEQGKDHTRSTGSKIGEHAVQVNAVSKTKVKEEMNKGAVDSGLLPKEEDDTYGLKINFKESPVRIRDRKKESSVRIRDRKKESTTRKYEMEEEDPELVRIAEYAEWADEDDPELVRIAEYAEWAKKVGNM